MDIPEGMVKVHGWVCQVSAWMVSLSLSLSLASGFEFFAVWTVEIIWTRELDLTLTWWQPSPKSSKLLRCNPADGQDWLSWSKIKWSNICVPSCNLYMPTMDKRFDHFMYIESRMTSVTLRVKSSQSEWHGSNIVSLPCCNLSRLNDALN